MTPQYFALFTFLPLFHDVRVGLVVVRLVSRLFAVVLLLDTLFLIHPSVCVVKVSQFPFGNLNGIGVLIRLLS